MAKCSYKNSLRGCVGNGIVENHVIVHYNLRDYDQLELCGGCTEKITIDVLKDLERDKKSELSLYVFDVEYNIKATVHKGE